MEQKTLFPLALLLCAALLPSIAYAQTAPMVTETFIVVEEMPRFPGCEDLPSRAKKEACADKALQAFLKEHLQYPEEARNNKVQGTVLLTFIVTEDGTIEEPQIARDIGAGCGEEALRLVHLMMEQGLQWAPGRQMERAVRFRYKLPVQFRLKGKK